MTRDRRSLPCPGPRPPRKLVTAEAGWRPGPTEGPAGGTTLPRAGVLAPATGASTPAAKDTVGNAKKLLPNVGKKDKLGPPEPFVW